ncbi:polyphosphate glucokinase [Mycobacterium tuberculosis]|nr:polyphosphate glucokinase [Mycobacterium tuberculosis]
MTSTGPETSETPGATTQRHGFGIDVGGSGIKGGIVDLDTGQLIGDRIKLLTPQPATPLAVAKTIARSSTVSAGGVRWG